MRINYFVWFSMTVFLMRTELEVRVVKIEYFNPDKIFNASPFFLKERYGSATPFFDTGAGAERHSKKVGKLNTLLMWHTQLIACAVKC